MAEQIGGEIGDEKEQMVGDGVVAIVSEEDEVEELDSGTYDEIFMMEQKNDIGKEKEQKGGDDGVTSIDTCEDVAKVERNDDVSHIMEQRGEENNELDDSDGNIASSCCCWCIMRFIRFSIFMPGKVFIYRRHSARTFEGEADMDYDQEFGRDTNRNDYFAVRSLDVYEGEDLSSGGGGGGTFVARSLNPKTGSGAASEKLIGGEGRGIRPPPWWKKYWLKLTGR